MTGPSRPWRVKNSARKTVHLKIMLDELLRSLYVRTFFPKGRRGHVPPEAGKVNAEARSGGAETNFGLHLTPGASWSVRICLLLEQTPRGACASKQTLPIHSSDAYLYRLRAITPHSSLGHKASNGEAMPKIPKPGDA